MKPVFYWEDKEDRYVTVALATHEYVDVKYPLDTKVPYPEIMLLANNMEVYTTEGDRNGKRRLTQSEYSNVIAFVDGFMQARIKHTPMIVKGFDNTREIEAWYSFYMTFNDDNRNHADNCFDSKNLREASAEQLHKENIKWAREVIKHYVNDGFLRKRNQLYRELCGKREYDFAIPYFLEVKYGLIVTGKGLFDAVIEEYFEGDEELCSLFFNLFVSMPEREILEAYKSLQQRINGDLVCRVEDGQVLYNKPLIKDGEFEEIFTGNCMEFLMKFNGNESFTRICGETLDFSESEQLDFIL